MLHTELTISVRLFPVLIRNPEDGKTMKDEVVLTREQLQACQLVGQSSKELIHRLYGRRGFEVVDIYKATKREICMSLDELYQANFMRSVGKREKVSVDAPEELL